MRPPRRLHLLWSTSLRGLAGLVAAASGVHSLYEWRDPEHVYTGVIAITAAAILWHGARRALREPSVEAPVAVAGRASA